ncbi:MAG: rhomboid family intramembrane serine protease [Gammaproteobacteria bacterium]|nr:rhomboid family intramembrane serine protease [Gammaproteobacteria bacterium]
MRSMSRFWPLVTLIAILWLIEVVNFLTGHSLNRFGLVPRTTTGLPGIALAPLLHGSFTHLLSNTMGLAVLGGLVALRGRRHFIVSMVALVLAGGLLLWLIGRPSVHVGASGLVFGFFGLLLAQAWYRRTWDSILIATAVVLLYGGLIAGLSPLQRYVSWEGHLAGLVAGVLIGRLTQPRQA